MPNMASTTPMKTRNVSLPNLNQADIGKFVGRGGYSLRKFVVGKATNAYIRDQGGDPRNDSSPPVNVRLVSSDQDSLVVANCSAPTDDLLDLIQDNLLKHVTHFRTDRPKICRLVFKTTLNEKLIRKYIGVRGKNIIVLTSILEQDCAAKNLVATSFRINIDELGIYEDEPRKFFYINNDGDDTAKEVFIKVSANFKGNPRILFQCIKQRMITSVVDCARIDAENQKTEADEFSEADRRRQATLKDKFQETVDAAIQHGQQNGTFGPTPPSEENVDVAYHPEDTPADTESSYSSNVTVDHTNNW